MTISFSQWVSESISTLRSGDRSLPVRLLRPLYNLYVGVFLTSSHRYPYGTPIFEKEWDALIVLDACRVDALREVADEYEFLDEIDSIRSVGSTSFEWLNHTFSAEYFEEIQRTGYVTGNGYTERVFDDDGHTGNAAIPFGPSSYDTVASDDFGYLEELWRAEFENTSEWSVGSGDGCRVHPRYATDRVIDVGRTTDVDRLIVHYMYPHDPFPLADGSLQKPFDALKSGSVPRDAVWEAYLDNLRFVLDEIEILLGNLNRDNVVITADHGEAFGEYGFYRHVIGCPIPCMRRVPWVETTSEDRGEYDPEAPGPETVSSTASVEDRLEQLGYL
ncbi:alkaline phosphatase family protein [Natronorubrum halophilum]|uniref:hypothetical protein n=1 Tax=Natronorubrum halophilum TaxID=1702106 RepID=UPI0010C1BAC7|nr:hypothetical protein [Natronorubrum halophilum]